MSEQILEPGLPIIDPHHHLWDRPTAILRNLPPSDHGFMDIIRDIPRYLLDELLAGHDVKVSIVLGHNGHPENEACDRMAVAAYKNLKKGF